MSEERSEAALIYREVAEAFLDGPEVKAAGIFERQALLGGRLKPLYRFLEWLWDLTAEEPIGPFRGRFLVAVTADKVHVLRYRCRGQIENFRITKEVAEFERDEVWLRDYAGGEIIYLESRTDQIDLDGAAVAENPGAAEVVAALSD